MLCPKYTGGKIALQLEESIRLWMGVWKFQFSHTQLHNRGNALILKPVKCLHISILNCVGKHQIRYLHFFHPYRRKSFFFSLWKWIRKIEINLRISNSPCWDSRTNCTITLLSSVSRQLAMWGLRTLISTTIAFSILTGHGFLFRCIQKKRSNRREERKKEPESKSNLLKVTL